MINVCRLSFLSLFLSAGYAPAQNMDVQEIKTVMDLIEVGREPIYVLLALSVFTVFLILFFLFTLRGNVLFPKKWQQQAKKAASQGDTEALQNICANNGSAASQIVANALEQIQASNQEVDYTVVRDALEGEGSRQAGILWQRIQYLMDVAIIAPMVGLLGTVLGMLRAFSNIQAEVGSVKPLTLAQGVTQALVTTATGLSVGIFAMIVYAIFRGRVHKLISRLETTCNRILRNLVFARS